MFPRVAPSPGPMGGGGDLSRVPMFTIASLASLPNHPFRKSCDTMDLSRKAQIVPDSFQPGEAGSQNFRVLPSRHSFKESRVALYLLNSPVLTDFGRWSYCGPLTVEEARALVEEGFHSAIGHVSTANILSRGLERLP